MSTNRSNLRHRATCACALGLLLSYLTAPAWGVDIDPVLTGLIETAPPQDVVVAGSYAYLATQAGLEVIDVSNPAGPQRVGSYSISGSAHGVAVSGNYTYVAAGELYILDVTIPSKPLLKARYFGTNVLTDVSICPSVGCAVVSSFDGPIEVIDVVDPGNPVKVGAFPFETHCLTTAGKHVYAGGHGRTAIIDIVDPAKPVQRGSIQTLPWATDIAVRGTLIFVTSDASGMPARGALEIIDVSDPDNPQRVSSYLGNASGVAVSGYYAYVKDWEGLKVIDISDTANPQLVGSYSAGSSGWPGSCLAVSGRYAYVVGSGGALEVIDISRLANPQRVGAHDTIGEAFAVVVAGNYAYLAERPRRDGTNDVGCALEVIDISNSTRPQRVGGYDQLFTASALAVSGGYAYVCGREDLGGRDSLHVIDVSNPAAPKWVSRCESRGALYEVAIAGSHAYVIEMWWDPAAQQPRGQLTVIDVTNPANPQKVGSYSGAPYPYGMVVSGKYSYMAQGSAGLEVIDISDPANPLRIGGIAEGFASRVAVSGNYAWVLNGGQGCHVIDISNPANPRRMGSLENIGWANAMAVSEKYAYLASGRDLQVMDISDPANPQRLGGNSAFSGETLGVTVSQGKVFVTDLADGLVVLEMQPLIKSIWREGPSLRLQWEGFGPARLQRTTSLTGPLWQDLIGSESTNSVTLPIWGGPEFFRLAKP